MKIPASLCIALAMSASAFSQTSAPAAPTLTAGAEFKGLRFDWDTVPGATWYQLEYRAHQNGPFVQQGDDFPATATSTHFSFPVHLFDWSWGRYRLAACNDAGCTRSAAISVYNLRRDAVGYIKAGASKAGALFGSSLDLSPDGYSLVVAAPGEVTSTSTGPVGGGVYVFRRGGDAKWSQRARLDINARGKSDVPGLVELSVAVSGSGNTVAVGSAPPDTCCANTQEGQVDVFFLKDGVYTRRRIPRPDGITFFGHVQLSESGYVLGVSKDRGDFEMAIYKSVNGVWQNVYSSPPNDDMHPCTLWQLSRDGKTLARMCTDYTLDGFHYVALRHYVRVLSGTNWSVATEIELWSRDSGFPSYSHPSITLDRTGSTIAVSFSRQYADPVTGFVRVFQRDGVGYRQVAQLDAGSWTPESQRVTFGSFLSMGADGHTLAVGAPSDSGQGSGPRTPPLVAGTEETGAVYVYRLADSWKLVNVIKPNYYTAAQRGEFGKALKLSQTGKTLVIGVATEDSSASGIDGNWANSNRTDSGAVFMY
jgi:trimeric autotransporter adhesin